MRILIFGGTRFFGKHLVRLLTERGDDVTIGTRGNTSDSFGDRISRVVVDRSDRNSMLNAIGTTSAWDIIYDNICFTASDAAITSELFDGRVGRYIHTSTLSVYKKAGSQTESDFDPYSYPYDLTPLPKPSYGEGKRQAEAYYFQHARFPVAACRIPVVLGPDDYTGRLDFHIKRVLEAKPIVIPNLNAASCFISSTEAADFLNWLGLQNSFTGPLNACANGQISIGNIVKLIERATRKEAIIQASGEEKDQTPFIGEESWYADNTKARELGYPFTNLMDWLPALIEGQTKILSQTLGA